MKLLCTFQPGGLTVEGQTPTAHRLYLDFATRIGLDGHTPEIGPNGNWWIVGTDTGVPAASLLRYGSYLEFPNVGQANALYLDTAANKLYRWNGNDLHYYAVGTDYNDIKIIDGGNA